MQTYLQPKPGDNGALCISPATLQAADILVSTGPKLSSRVSRGASKVSHAAIYRGDGNVIEALNDQGVICRPIQLAMKEATFAIAYRVRHISARQRDVVISAAMSPVQEHAEYDWKGVVLRVLCILTGSASVCRGRPGITDKFYCSDLVWKAFDAAGVSIVDKNKPAPGDPGQFVEAYYSDNKLEYVGQLV